MALAIKLVIKMEYFKFTKKCFVPSLLRGELFFSSLEYFRFLEASTGDSRIGDRYEGRSIGRAPDVLFDGVNLVKGSEADLKIIAGEHGVPRGVTLSVTGLQVVQDVGPALVFCFAEDPYEPVATVFSRHGAGYTGYGASVSIADPHALARQIAETGRVMSMYGQAVGDLFHVEVGPVKYEWRETAWGYEQSLPANGFYKRNVYKCQQEWRVILKPKAHVTSVPDQTMIVISDAAEVLQVYDSNICDDEDEPSETASSIALAHDIVEWLFAHPPTPDPSDWLVPAEQRAALYDLRAEWSSQFNQQFWTRLLGVTWAARLKGVETSLSRHYTADEHFFGREPDLKTIFYELARLSRVFKTAR